VLVLSAFAALAGVALTLAAVRFLGSIQLPTDTPIVIAVQLDSRVLAFATIASLLSAILTGIVPAWRSLSPEIASALKTGEASPGAGKNRLRGRSTLVVAQVALSLVLLVVSATLLDAFNRMLLLDPGIRTDRVMMVEFDPTLAQYTPEQARQFYRTLIERIRELPGVRSASLARGIPFRPNFTDEAVVPEGYQFPRDQKSVTVPSNVVDDSYFRTMAVTITRGREFNAGDTADSRRVAIVNDEFARSYWSTQDPVGKRLRLGPDGPHLEVIGVARTGKYLSLAEAPQPYFYLPFSQHPRTRMTLLVHTEGEATALTDGIMRTIRSLDPNQPVYNVRNMRNYFEQGVLGIALTVMKMVWSMGALGLLLAVTGLYGLLSYSVSRRSREIGIRMAIGADRSQVLKLVLRQGLILALIGCSVGLAIGIPVFRGLRAGLSGLGPLNPWTLAIVPAALIVVALAACFIPAQRASRIDPNVALRLE
jgi:predicted permease